MGNRESSEESVVEDESEEKKKTKNDEQQCTADGTDGALGINVEQLTYNDIYLEESHESDEGLTDFTEDDSEDGDWRHMREFPDSVSVVSRARAFTAHLLLVVSYNRPQSALNVRIKGTTDVPGRGQGGPDAYQLMVTLMNNARQREYSKLRIGPNPTFDDKWTFHLPSADMMNAVMRFRLYACSLGQRTGVLGEGKLELSEVNPRLENSLTIRLVPPMEILTESEDEKNDPENKARIQGFIGEVGRNMNEMAQVPLPHPLDSELLLNAAYNPKTGRFECIVQQAHGINVPGTKNSKPCKCVRTGLSLKT
ncbi:hypothetical protein D915_000632 [Fasciola hepatica]|uniref:C2 domain-containing protein n=1 Tax=Fasciola hepatica TaxID=6192 RepID=A0A4E0RL06_FASHE|nr:hypothetical protein D915_000632 [Fasciola hepatica]